MGAANYQISDIAVAERIWTHALKYNLCASSQSPYTNSDFFNLFLF